MNNYNLKFPIGEFIYPENISNQEFQDKINIIAQFPKTLAILIKHCSLNDFEKKYREGGWAIYQVIHHLVDSHLNAFIRLKFALLEDNFTAKLYDENTWIDTPENTLLNSLSSVEFLKHLHFRWSELLYNLKENKLSKTFFNPFSKRTISLMQHTALYAWHSNHHLEHIKIALNK